jgi:acetyl-CoA C-acetyltransferase
MSVVVMGVGFCGSFPTSTGLSYREMIKRAATAAYDDAGLTAEEIDGAVSVEEDFVSGYSIADEYVPDQLGMVRKPVYTIPGDFLHGLSSAVMQLKTGRFKTVAVEAYVKSSNIKTKDELLHFAYDPIFNRLGVSPHYLAGIEMQHFLSGSAYSEADVAEVVARNRQAGLGNPLAPYAARIDALDVLTSRPLASPVTEQMFARPADGAVVVVLGIGEEMLEKVAQPVYITGTGWSSGNSIIERRMHGVSAGTALAGEMAYREAGIELPSEEIDVYYISDLYAHRQLMHMEALQLSEDCLPFTNPDGGSQAFGDLFEANGGARFYDAVRMLRGQAGAHQIPDAEVALVHGWRGLPTDSAAVVILEGEGRD